MINKEFMNRIMKASDNKYADILNKSEIIKDKDFFSTSIPALNIALSGDVDGGMECGSMQIVGESKSFKTLFMLILAKAYMDKHKDAPFLFFDSEHGAAEQYFDTVGIDKDRVIHLPIVSVEDLRIQCAKILKDFKRGEKAFFGVDSVGLLPSDKEIVDAEDGKSTADLTRARALNSFWRIVTPQLPLLNIPMVVVNHAYDTLSLYPTQVVKGGKGGYLASTYIWMISKSQNKDSTNALLGFDFNIKIEKSRKVREKAVVPITVSFKSGIEKYSGILDIAIDGGFIVSPKKGSYALATSPEVIFKKTKADPYLEKLVSDEKFREYVRTSYQLSHGSLMNNTETAEEDEDIDE